MRYVQAAQRDWQDVAGLCFRLWPSDSPEDFEQDDQLNLANPDNAIFLAYEGDAAVGFANCSLRHDYVEGTAGGPVGFLEGIYVLQEARGHGVARTLAALCEDWARARGCREFASDCELDNTASLAFHLRIGFEEVNRIICFKKDL